MMSKNIYYMFLLLSAVAGLFSVSDAEIHKIYVCPGDSVQAFQNIEFNNCSAHISLSINGERNVQIALWSIQNCILNESLHSGYQRKLMFDLNGTITIQNFHHFDQAKYVVKSQMDPLSKIYEVELSAMVAPTTACKPVIEQLGNILKASLNAKDCGQPVATPYWKDYHDVSNTNEPILKLIPGMENKEYYACIKSAAQTCVKNVASHDYCTTFKPEGSKSPPASLETCNANALLTVCIILGILLLVAFLARAVTFIRYRLKKKNMKEEQATKMLKTSKLWKKKWRKDFDVEKDIEEENTEQQICNDPDKIKELLELCNAILCKICLLRKMNMFFLPCSHMATCTECSSSISQCPVCRAEIKQKLTIGFD